MSSNAVLSLKNVSKLFRQQKQRTFKELLPALLGGKSIVDSFWALKNVSFEVEKGETFAIIGPNGSGKSTLLKLISGVTEATRGKIKVRGRIAPLIELGAGFHPELTGRENIYLNGVILGMKRKEIAERFQEIVDFAEIADFIDQPVKHYSSGMYLRLAFSVAVHVNPDVLLVDEILTVGDEYFQQKCYQKLAEFKKNGVTIIIVSHYLEQVEAVADRVALVVKGDLVEVGDPRKVIDTYKKEFA